MAVDNLWRGLLRKGVAALRVGAAVADGDGQSLHPEVCRGPETSSVRSHRLEALIEDDPDISSINQRLAALRGSSAGRSKDEKKQSSKEWSSLQRQLDQLVLARVKGFQVICCTLIGMGSRHLRDVGVDRLLLDEACQTTVPALAVALNHCTQHARVVLVGDPCQLPTTTALDGPRGELLGTSLFQLAMEKRAVHLLDTQYRMHPEINAFPSRQFYGGRVQTAASTRDREAFLALRIWPDPSRPVLFVPTLGSEVAVGTSKQNHAEANSVLRVVKLLLGGGGARSLLPSVGIITPYAGQIGLLRRAMSKYTGMAGLQLEVASVDAFQGREMDVIVFSAVRANDKGEMGFLGDWRRLNVALTRAKHGLIVVGHPATLACDPTWAAWLAWVETRGLKSDLSGLAGLANVETSLDPYDHVGLQRDKADVDQRLLQARQELQRLMTKKKASKRRGGTAPTFSGSSTTATTTTTTTTVAITVAKPTTTATTATNTTASASTRFQLSRANIATMRARIAEQHA